VAPNPYYILRFKRIAYQSGETLLIKYYRLLRDLSQDELTDLCKLSEGELSTIESGKNITRNTRIKLAEALNVEPWQLCYFDDLDKLIASVEEMDIAFKKKREEAKKDRRKKKRK